MKTLCKIITLACLIASAADAQQLFLRRPKINTTPAYLLSEKFEGTGTPSGWTPTGTYDFDNTSNPLDEAQDLRMADASSTVDTVAWAGQSDVYIAFLLYTDAAPGSLGNIGYLYDASNAQVARMSFTSGAVTMRALAIGGTISSSSANSVSTVAGTGTPVWAATNGSGNVVFQFATTYAENNETFNVAYGANANSTDALTPTDGYHIGPSVTPTYGNPASTLLGNVQVRLRRTRDHASDTLDAGVFLLRVLLQYTESTTEPSALP